MTHAAAQEAHNDLLLLHYIWNNRAVGDAEFVRGCALDAFCEQLADSPVEGRRRAFLLAVGFLQALVDLDTDIDERFAEQRQAILERTPAAADDDAPPCPELDAAFATAKAALARLDAVYDSVLERGYFDADPLTAEQLKRQIGDYCYSCDCRCPACARSHAAGSRAFLWPAMLDEHASCCERSAAAQSTLDAGEEVADIIGNGAI